MSDYKWDLFICHAWEDKDAFVRPLAESLAALGLRVWYDQFVLRVGHSLLRSIEHGLVDSSYGIVVISKAFFAKEIPQHELRGLLTRQLHEGRKTILPIWHGVTKEEVIAFSPSLADLLALRTAEMSAEEIGLAILAEVRPDMYRQYERSDLLKLYKSKPLHELHEELTRLREELSEFQCPHCGAPMEQHVQASLGDVDVDTKVFACGRKTESGWVDVPCPATDDIPEFDEYDIEYDDYDGSWSAMGKARTPQARRFGGLYPYYTRGRMTKRDARNALHETYLMQFKHREWRELQKRGETFR